MVALSGCASLQYAGNASYTVEPFADRAGGVHCCRVTIADGKERAALDVHVSKVGENVDITFSERSVTAFQGQAIAVGATSEAIDEAAKAATLAILSPVLPALLPILTSGTAGAALGGAALGAGANKLLAPAPAAAVTRAALLTPNAGSTPEK
jgi:hypothetical protein